MSRSLKWRGGRLCGDSGGRNRRNNRSIEVCRVHHWHQMWLCTIDRARPEQAKDEDKESVHTQTRVGSKVDVSVNAAGQARYTRRAFLGNTIAR